MQAKKKRAPPPKTKTKAEPPPKLSKTEEDLLWHMSHGYQLETSSLWDNPILRHLKDNTEVRACFRNTSLRHNPAKTPNHLALLVDQGFCNAL